MGKEEPVFKSLEIIEKRISEKLTVENIARSVYFSKWHYQRLFREIVGDSVMEYVVKRKLSLAGRALLETDDNILDIALKLGYDSHESFTRSFKAYMGVTPTDYRKYGLDAISQKTVKEASPMLYSKTTDEIIRELNGAIVKTKEAAEYVRKNCGPEWGDVADKTDTRAERLKSSLSVIGAIGERPDEIGGRFAIINAIEGMAFESNLQAFHVGLMASRKSSEEFQALKPLMDKYYELARISQKSVGIMGDLFNELTTLILGDMRRTAAGKIRDIDEKGRTLCQNFKGHEYIKEELSAMLDKLTEVPLDKLTIKHLEGFVFWLDIIGYAADVEGLASLKSSAADAVDFFRTIKNLQNDTAPAPQQTSFIENAAFQGNILLFFLKAEVSGENKAVFEPICNKIRDFINFAQEGGDESLFMEMAERVWEVHGDMIKAADKLKEKGGPIRFIAGEVENLAKRVDKLTKG